MKFSHQLKFNSVPEWKENYLNYSQLKKLIYQIAFAENNEISPDNPDTPLLSRRSSHALSRGSSGIRRMSIDDVVTHAMFGRAVEDELDRIISFFRRKHDELQQRLRVILDQLEAHERAEDVPVNSSHMDVEAGTGNSHEEHTSRVERLHFWHEEAGDAQWQKLRPQMAELYVDLSELVRFLDMNSEGLRKILKKHDKETSEQLLPVFMPRIKESLGDKNKSPVVKAVRNLTDTYAVTFFHGDGQAASSELGAQLRDRVEFERTTIWKDMVGMERRRVAAQVKSGPDAVEGAESSWLTFQRMQQPIACATAFTSLVILCLVPTFDTPEQRNCLALLVCVSLLWCTEALPLFVTSMLVPFLAVCLRVMKASTPDGRSHRLSAHDASEAIFHSMFTQVNMLLLGGFCDCRCPQQALHRQVMASLALSRIRRPSLVFLANMASRPLRPCGSRMLLRPLLCFSLAQPILRNLPAGHQFPKALVMGIALASNMEA
ncbi:hypothetical protein WJX84_004625 [Apatococcus fuscideae]|uniref:SPX domain-containing protein n=1 Tax=Apatococcus fuscideae TaxID=2026836 RepID=A0AAW1RK49_9CHLO